MSRYEYRFLNSVQSTRYYDRNVIICTIQATEEWIGRNSRKYSFVAARMIVTRRYRRVYVQYKKPGVSLSTEKICRVAGSHFYGA